MFHISYFFQDLDIEIVESRQRILLNVFVSREQGHCHHISVLEISVSNVPPLTAHDEEMMVTSLD